jgi:cobaltochelatase CobT
MLKAFLRYLETAAERYVARNAPSHLLPPVKPPGATYRIFTTEFDETIDGIALLARSDEVMERLQIDPYINVDLPAFATAIERLRANCRALTTRLQDALPEEQRDDTVITLLFDHSGSLRGTNYLIVAEVAEALADALTGAGIATEVLGFTTSRWRGGRSYQKWLKENRPPLPGRLNDLRHIVYLDGSNGPVTGPHRFPAMRREHLFKENIDGEALEWAYARLLAHARPRKILIIISDGAPVDDATLTHSWHSILVDHLKEVSARISTSEILLGGLGIERSVGAFYPRSAFAKPIAQLAEVAPRFVEELIALAHQ